MIHYAVYDPATGRVVMTGYVPTMEDVSSGEGFEHIVLPKKIEHMDLDELKVAVWNRVKDRKNTLSNGGVETTLGKVSTDLESQIILNRLVNQAIIDPNGSQKVTLESNKTILFENSEILEIGKQVNAALNQWHNTAQELRKRISAVKDEKALFKVDTINKWSL